MLLGLLAGGALYLLWQLPWNGKAGDELWSEPLGSAWLSVGMALWVQVPLFVGMAVTRWRAPRLWMGTAVLAAVIVLTGAWAYAGIAQAPRGHQEVLLRLAAALSLWWLVALAWMQGWMEQGSWRVPYARLFVLAWNNALVLALAALCVLLVWGVLWLWAGLFALLKVKWFADLFSTPLFVCLCTGLLTGLGLWVARSQQRPIQVARQTLLALGRLLLPLLAWVLVLFVAALLFTGVEQLWDIGFASGLLMGALLVHIWLVNAVYQDGAATHSPYPQWLQHLVHASLLALPVLATLACVAVGMRVNQYGWTAARVWATTGAALLWLYAAGYAVAAIQSWRGQRGNRKARESRKAEGATDNSTHTAARAWLGTISPVNRALSLVLLAWLLALQTPLLDPLRISAGSQLQRLQSGDAEIDLKNLSDLKFDHGRYGAAALEALAQSPRLQGEAQKKMLQTIRNRTSVHPEPDEELPSEVIDVPLAQQRITMASGHAAPAVDWWPWLLKQAKRHHWATSCLYDDAECKLLTGDWDRDGQADHILCDLKLDGSLRCELTARDAQGQWRAEGAVEWARLRSVVEQRQVRDALREGRIQRNVPRWPQWTVDLPAETSTPTATNTQDEAPDMETPEAEDAQRKSRQAIGELQRPW